MSDIHVAVSEGTLQINDEIAKYKCCKYNILLVSEFQISNTYTIYIFFLNYIFVCLRMVLLNPTWNYSATVTDFLHSLFKNFCIKNGLNNKFLLSLEIYTK